MYMADKVLFIFNGRGHNVLVTFWVKHIQEHWMDRHPPSSALTRQILQQGALVTEGGNGSFSFPHSLPFTPSELEWEWGWEQVWVWEQGEPVNQE